MGGVLVSYNSLYEHEIEFEKIYKGGFISNLL